MDYVIADGVRSLEDEGRAVLLDLRSGAYFALNAAGTALWDALAEGETRDAAIGRLEERFRVPRERIARDADALIAELAAKGLVVPRERPARAEEQGTRRGPGRLRALLEGAAALVGVDLLIRVAGFERFHRVVRSVPTRRAGAAGPGREAADAVVRGVDAAAGLYFKRAWCLQRSAAAACLLRLHGFPAELVIGVRRMPFLAHAWVEIDGAVINDDPRVRAFHTPIERC